MIMNRAKVKFNLNGLSDNLLTLHAQLNKQIKSETSLLTEAENSVVGIKLSIDSLRKRRDDVRETLRGFTEVRNDLVFVTGEKVKTPSWSSSSDVSESSDEDSSKEVWIYLRLF